MLSQDAIKELNLRFSGFDFKSAVDELVKWHGELDNTYYDDAITISNIEGFLDLLIDNCTF